MLSTIIWLVSIIVHIKINLISTSEQGYKTKYVQEYVIHVCELGKVTPKILPNVFHLTPLQSHKEVT